MKLTSRSSLAEVAACVAKALARAKIRAVLTGGACATIYSKGKYQSSDLDFVLRSAITPEQLDAVMESIGFHRTATATSILIPPSSSSFPPGPSGLALTLASGPSLPRSRGLASRCFLRPIRAAIAWRLSIIGTTDRA